MTTNMLGLFIISKKNTNGLTTIKLRSTSNLRIRLLIHFCCHLLRTLAGTGIEYADTVCFAPICDEAVYFDM